MSERPLDIVLAHIARFAASEKVGIMVFSDIPALQPKPIEMKPCASVNVFCM
jgi:hypothetical protein